MLSLSPISANEANVGSVYITPAGLKIKVLVKNEDGSMEVSLLEVLENGISKVLIIPLVEAEKTRLKLVVDKSIPAVIKPIEVKKEAEPESIPIPEITEKESKSSFIRRFILEGGRSADEIAVLFCAVYGNPGADTAKIKKFISVVYDRIKKEGHKVEKDKDRKFIIKGKT